MPDFFQQGSITTVHDFGSKDLPGLEDRLREATARYGIGLILPVTAGDMRSDPFRVIVEELREADYIRSIVVTLGVADDPDDYRETLQRIEPLGDRARVLWTDGPRVRDVYGSLGEAGIDLSRGGKGRSVWTAFGYLLADPALNAFVLHDCDILDYDRFLLARLCLPMAHPSFDFEFCKAYYARVTDRMNGRVVRLLVAPLVSALQAVFGPRPFLDFVSGFRYPLAGEFAMTAGLARSNRIPSDWGLEVGTLSEVFRNTTPKRVCQVDLCRLYDHKHQDLSLEDKSKGLMKMSVDICKSLLRTLAASGVVFDGGHLGALRASYLRIARDAVRNYHADAVMNGLLFDQHAEEQAVEGFADQLGVAVEQLHERPGESASMAAWSRVLSVRPELPQTLRDIVDADRHDHG